MSNLKPSLRQSAASLHGWAGLIAGWLLFVVFLFGTTAFFQQEISRWMRPELGGGAVTAKALDAASVWLSRSGAHAGRWTISIPPARGGDALSLSWQPRDDRAGKSRKAPGGRQRGKSERAKLDPISGRELTVRDTTGGFFLYRFHYDLHYMPVKWARYLVSIAALSMLVAILSGIVTHKKIFVDFFLLRFGKGQRSWLDGHNATAVLALPFHLMITYTGLVTLLFTLMPWAIDANYREQDQFYAAAFPDAPEREPTGRRAAMMPINALVARAAAVLGSDVGFLTIHNPGDASAMAQASPSLARLGGNARPAFLSAVTGEVLRAPLAVGGASATQGVMVDLHAGRFSGPMLRWLYFLSGVGGTVMVATGLVLWTAKRRAKLPDPDRPYFGFRLVERLNIGFIAGAPAGIAVYFLANRLLPLATGDRADWEVNSLFIAWGGIFVWTIARPVKQAWLETLAVTALLYALVPVINACTTTRGVFSSLMTGDWVFIGFDLTMLVTAAAFALTARKVAVHRPKVLARRKARAMAEVLA